MYMAGCSDPFLMTSFLNSLKKRLTTRQDGGENWGQLILQPNHGERQRGSFGSPLCSASLLELCFVFCGGRRKRRRSFELAKRLESTNSLCSTRPPTDWPNLNTCATLRSFYAAQFSIHRAPPLSKRASIPNRGLTCPYLWGEMLGRSIVP